MNIRSLTPEEEALGFGLLHSGVAVVSGDTSPPTVLLRTPVNGANRAPHPIFGGIGRALQARAQAVGWKPRSTYTTLVPLWPEVSPAILEIFQALEPLVAIRKVGHDFRQTWGLYSGDRAVLLTLVLEAATIEAMRLPVNVLHTLGVHVEGVLSLIAHENAATHLDRIGIRTETVFPTEILIELSRR